jgi:hypothetical protein
MKKIIKSLLLIFTSLIVLNCSNDDDNGSKAYFPKKITMETINGIPNNKELIFTYNTINLITKIEFVYFGTANVNSFKEIRIAYTANNDIKEIQSLSNDNLETMTTFNHDDFGVITQINFQSEDTDLEINANYNAQNNIYTLNGASAIFPLTFNFDNNDVIHAISGSAINNRTFNYNTQEIGLFKNLRQQPELIMWSEIFTFGSLNINLNYLTPYKLEKISLQSSNDYLFENFEIDNTGNLVKFTYNIIGVGIEHQHTISYENRNL